MSHIKLDTKSNGSILDIYTVQYSKDQSKYLIVIENKNDLKYDNVVDASFDFSNSSVTLLSHQSSLIETGVKTEEATWSRCFGDCLSAGLDPRNLLGQVIILGGAASGVCPPCGAVAGVYTGVLALGCAGGCFGN